MWIGKYCESNWWNSVFFIYFFKLWRSLGRYRLLEYTHICTVSLPSFHRDFLSFAFSEARLECNRRIHYYSVVYYCALMIPRQVLIIIIGARRIFSCPAPVIIMKSTIDFTLRARHNLNIETILQMFPRLSIHLATIQIAGLRLFCIVTRYSFSLKIN